MPIKKSNGLGWALLLAGALVAYNGCGKGEIQKPAVTQSMPSTEAQLPYREPTNKIFDSSAAAKLPACSDYWTLRSMLPNKEMKVEDKTKEKYGPFHSKDKLPNGTPVRTQGALTYILDDKDNPVSPGFHNIYPRSYGYLATLGASVTLLDKQGSPICTTSSYPLHYFWDNR